MLKQMVWKQSKKKKQPKTKSLTPTDFYTFLDTVTSCLQIWL